jgi:hypothetical protein
MPPQEIPPQDNGREENTMSQERDMCQSHPGSTHVCSKTDADTVSRVNALLPTSVETAPEITATSTTETQAEVRSDDVSTWAAVKMKLERQSSGDIDLKEKRTEGRCKMPDLPVQEEKAIMDFDDMLPHVGEFGLYQKILFALLAPFAFFVAFVYFTQIFITLTPEGYWCEVPQLRNLTAEQR